ERRVLAAFLVPARDVLLALERNAGLLTVSVMDDIFANLKPARGQPPEGVQEVQRAAPLADWHALDFRRVIESKVGVGATELNNATNVELDPVKGLAACG